MPMQNTRYLISFRQLSLMCSSKKNLRNKHNVARVYMSNNIIYMIIIEFTPITGPLMQQHGLKAYFEFMLNAW